MGCGGSIPSDNSATVTGDDRPGPADPTVDRTPPRRQQRRPGEVRVPPPAGQLVRQPTTNSNAVADQLDEIGGRIDRYEERVRNLADSPSPKRRQTLSSIQTELSRLGDDLGQV